MLIFGIARIVMIDEAQRIKNIGIIRAYEFKWAEKKLTEFL
jgi:hypothetical protein